MGKARKHSRGKSSPVYMVEGTDNEMEEGPALKRSRFSFHGDSFGVPLEVMSLSKISMSERKNLVEKFNMELEQVRDLRKRIACISADTVLLSPYSDNHSCSDGRRRRPQDNFVTISGMQGRKCPPLRNDKQQSKKGQFQRSVSGRLDVRKGSTFASVMKECEKLLDRLWSHKKGWPFHIPVDPVLLNIPDYFTVIKHPMDLGTIRNRLRNNEYSSPLDFAADVRLTFSNSMTYNPPGNQYHIMAQDISTFFESRWKVIEKKISVVEPPVMLVTSSTSLESEIPYKAASPRKQAAAVNESKLRVEPVKLVMTDGEKKKLNQDLEALEEEFPQNIVDLLREQSGFDGQSGEVEIEIDIDTLPDEILFKVRKLLDDYLREKKKSQEKSEPCEMEIIHDSGFSNSTLQPSKGDLLIDEDVDIVGGNDPPVSSHPPLKIEKDAACRNNECSSSSSSSSESGSSSSDSDSCSSSGSEIDSIKASKPTSAEDKKEPGVGIHKKDDDINGEKIVVNALNDLGQVEHDVGEKSSATYAVDVLPDEATAPPERQLSPEKRYRAALLKNRFADTIMKAREKTLTKDEKVDPEKLRIEREEFEKRLKEEKARLQAEAKAAEEARRKAEAEAAEKARREREQEREAARQALQKMEQTVEIHEGRRFMEDLEMFRATSAEGTQLSTFMEEMSSESSQNLLGSFKMEGISNPLEKLGLYMKMDEDEDDEEDEPHISQGVVDEQSLDRRERQTLSPCRVEGEDQVVGGNEEKARENGNHEDEKPINQKGGEEQMENVLLLSPHKEEGEVQLSTGNECREEPVSQKAEDSGNHEDEKLVDQNEGEEQSEKASDHENVVVDKGEQEAEVVDKGEEEAEVVDKRGEEETKIIDMGEVETEVAEKEDKEAETEVAEKEDKEAVTVDMGQKESEVVEKGEAEAVDVDMGEEETGTVAMGEQETELGEKVEVETEVVKKAEEDAVTVNMGEKESEVAEKGEVEALDVDMGEQESEVAEKGELESEDVDMGKQESEVARKGEEEAEDVDMGEQETEVTEMRHVEAKDVDMGEEKTEVIEKGEEETEVLGMGEEETKVVEKGGIQTQTVDMGEEETDLVKKEKQETEPADITETEVIDKGDLETEVVEQEGQQTETVDMGEEETDVAKKEMQETEPADITETEVIDKGDLETIVFEKEGQQTETVELGEEETEIVEKGQETEVVSKGDQESEVDEKREQESEAVEVEKLI